MTFTFYATLSLEDMKPCVPDVPVLLPASSWSRAGLAEPKVPDYVTRRAADCGGFVATRVWGDYRYTPDEYVNWLYKWSPQWAATMDYCCESPITGGRQEVVYKRQDRTTKMAYHFWENYRNTPWCWVLTIQGWEPEDYRKHARELRELIGEMSIYYGPLSEWRVGVGTLCARADVPTIGRVLDAVRDELPGVPLHLWGIKLGALKAIDLTNIVSSDSAAWNGLQNLSKRWEARRAAEEGPLTQREYAITTYLPLYVEKVQKAVAREALPDIPDLSTLQIAIRQCGWTLRVKRRGLKVYVYAVRHTSKMQEVYLGILDVVLSDIDAALVCLRPPTCTQQGALLCTQPGGQEMRKKGGAL